MRYEKGRKDASRQKIIDVASERFRCDGIAATGLAAIMSDAGMTNGAFYPHFASKADLVRETIVAATDAQSEKVRELIGQNGLEATIEAYLCPAHRDTPGQGCPFAALLPELARQPPEARAVYALRFESVLREFATALPANANDPEGTAIGIYAALIGALQLARAVEGTELSDRILAAGRDAALALARNR